MRLHADRPIEVLRAFVTQHLPVVWPNPWELPWLDDRTQPVLPLQTCFVDRACTEVVDPREYGRRLIVGDQEREIVIVAGLAVGIDSESSLLVLNDQLEPRMAVHTDSARRDDGVVQISGAEPGVVVLGPDQMRNQEGRRLLEGGVTVKHLKLEERSPAGRWGPAGGAMVTLPQKTRLRNEPGPE